MEGIKYLSKFSPEESTTFLESFDTVLTDCDGVLWHYNTPIPGAIEAVKRLQDIGKRVLFVSNNSTYIVDDYVQKLKKFGFDALPDQIVIPSLVISWHLRKINFEGKAYVIGTPASQKTMKNNGIDVITGPNSIMESADALKELLELDPKVKAVIFDIDINLNWAKMQQASLYLEKDDVLFLSAVADRDFPTSQKSKLLGNAQFKDILVDRTGKQATDYAKPSEILKHYLIEHYEMSDPRRCIFVGDSLLSDMKFAKICGFWQLWVGSGLDNPESCLSKNIKPEVDFYSPGLNVINELIDKSTKKLNGSCLQV